jgi:hypothetical protein
MSGVGHVLPLPPVVGSRPRLTSCKGDLVSLESAGTFFQHHAHFCLFSEIVANLDF